MNIHINPLSPNSEGTIEAQKEMNATFLNQLQII